MGKMAKWAAGACLGMAACCAHALSPMGPQDYERMRTPGQAPAVMLSACASTAQIDAVRALAKVGAKATVFVSADAIAEGSPLRAELLARPDLFEVGSLGATCMGKRKFFEGIAQAAAKREPEPAEVAKAMEDLAGDIVLGSQAIEKAFGAKPKFFAFGLDFDNSATDPFESSRLLAGLADYFAKPSPQARYDAFAGAKAGFAAWVVLAKLDRGLGSGAGNSFGEGSIEAKLAKLGISKSSKKASQAWIPSKRGAFSAELAPR